MAVRLFVGNLPYSATETELREYFSAVGPVSYISLPTDRETGRPRGFAFIEYNDPAQAKEAVRRFNNQPFKGRPIAVNEARPKEERPAGGSSFRPQAPRPERRPLSPEPAPGDFSAPREAPGRNFGPDAAPRRNRKQFSRPSKGERAPKGPIPVRSGGQFFGDDDDDYNEDDLGENFASRENDYDDDDT